MTGAMALRKQMASLMIVEFTGAIKKANPNVPNALRDTLPEIVNAAADETIPVVRQSTILLYHRFFSNDEPNDESPML